MRTEVYWSVNIYLTNSPYSLAKKVLESRKLILLFHMSSTRGLPSTAQKWSFPLRISSVNMSKSTVSCGFGHIHWKNP